MVEKRQDFKARFKEDHPHTLIMENSFGVIGVGTLVQIKEDGHWTDGVVDNILYAINERQLSFLVRVGYGVVVSIPHREGEILTDLRPLAGRNKGVGECLIQSAMSDGE